MKPFTTYLTDGVVFIKSKPTFEVKGKKKVWVAYLLWLTFGWFGFHHLYLRRERQAFLWFALFGGYFGVGWLRDLFMIPTYVKDANDDEKYMEELDKEMKKHKQKPPIQISSLFFEALVGQAFAYVWSAAVPREEIYGCQLVWLIQLVPLVTAIGVHTVGNIGRQKGDLFWPIIGAYLAYPCVLYYNSPSSSWVSISSAFLFEWKGKRWRKKSDYHKRSKFRILNFFLCVVFYLSLIGSYIYFNAEMTDKTGETVKVRDAIGNFFASPMWNEFVFSLGQVYNYAQAHGWWKIWEELVEKLDPQGEQNALKVLGLSQQTTQEEITTTYRQLAKKWHPDRHKDPEEKAKAQEQFMIVQQAYELLSKIKGRRDRRHRSEL